MHKHTHTYIYCKLSTKYKVFKAKNKATSKQPYGGRFASSQIAVYIHNTANPIELTSDNRKQPNSFNKIKNLGCTHNKGTHTNIELCLRG
jgi:hypothetical protein